MRWKLSKLGKFCRQKIPILTQNIKRTASQNIKRSRLVKWLTSSHLLCGLRRAEEDGHEGQPHDAGGVHGEADGLGFVEGLGDASAFDGVNSARDHEQDAVAQAADQRQVGHVALQDPARQLGVGRTQLFVVDDGVRRHDAEPDKHSNYLHREKRDKDVTFEAFLLLHFTDYRSVYWSVRHCQTVRAVVVYCLSPLSSCTSQCAQPSYCIM